MELDKNYKVPEGFEPVLNYRNTDDGEPDDGEPVVGYARLLITNSKRYLHFDFCIKDGAPTLPLKNYGELWSTGWDIPTRWAVDAHLQCWMDDAHGHVLNKTMVSSLLAEAESERDKNNIRQIFNMKPMLPDWVRSARAAGWTPPSDWDESHYE